MKHYFLLRYLPGNFSYKGFLRDFFREPTLDFKTFPALGIVTSLCLTLGGCSTTSETFDCKAGKGVGCKSISEVNQMVDQGALEDGTLGTGGNNVTIMSPPAPVIAAAPSEGKPADIQGGDLRLLDGGHVHRISEEHLRVWMAPFQDDQGNLHEGSVIHTVLKPGYWQLHKRSWEGGTE